MKLFVFLLATIMMATTTDAGAIKRADRNVMKQCVNRMLSPDQIIEVGQSETGNCNSKRDDIHDKADEATGNPDEVIRIGETCEATITLLQCMVDFAATNCKGIDVRPSPYYHAFANYVRGFKDTGNARCSELFNSHGDLFMAPCC